MNKQKILLIIGLIVIVLILIWFCLFLLKKLQIQNNNQNNININRPVNQKIISNYCEGTSETGCFTKLSGCLKANSISDYLNKKRPKTTLNDSPEKLKNKIIPPIQTNFPSAEIFLNIQLLGGGDYGSSPYIKLGNSYCDLNEENSKIVFAPIKSKEDALKYFLFIRKDLGSALDQTQLYIMKKEDYEDTNIKENTHRCSNDYKEKLQNRITEIKEVEDGYLITFIGFNYMGRIEFFESKIKIKTDGTIEEISRETLLDCGFGYVF